MNGSGARQHAMQHEYVPAPRRAAAGRFILWIDRVGAYLVCESNEITLGQPAADAPIDVPIMGDISRRHAVIRRDGEGYLLVPLRATRVGAQAIGGATLLADGDEFELGDAVRLAFRRPHPLSRTARLDFVSRHRPRPTVDGVLLFAESCVLGPSTACHVRCAGWSKEVVIFRRGHELVVRREGTYTVDGRSVAGAAAIRRTSRVAGDDFAFCLEPLDERRSTCEGART